MKIRSAESTVEHKLIDELVYYDQIQAKLREKLGIEEDDEIEAISVEKYARVQPKSEEDDKSWELKDEIAIIYANGGPDAEDQKKI